MTKIVSREDVIAMLIKWQQRDVDAKHIHTWAENIYMVDGYSYDDWEDGESNSVTNEALAALDMLNMNLMTEEDIPAYIEFLKSPAGCFKEAYIQLQKHLDSIDYNGRKKELAEIEVYAPFCSK